MLVYSAPTFRSTLLGGAFRGTPVTMRCWIDSAWYDGTNRWFFVEAAGYDPRSGRPRYLRGYASANSVTQQSRVPHC